MQPVHGIPCLSPYDSWNRLQFPCESGLDKWKKINGFDGFSEKL